jgi:hypothetical protein
LKIASGQRLIVIENARVVQKIFDLVRAYRSQLLEARVSTALFAQIRRGSSEFDRNKTEATAAAARTNPMAIKITFFT